MGSIDSGNLNSFSNEDMRGWFIGNFVKDNPNFNSNDFEVKWGIHKKGRKKEKMAANKESKTISILIQGKFIIRYPKDNKETILSKVGDYVYHDPKIFHTSEALEDSIILTIRWPSIPNDQEPID